MTKKGAECLAVGYCRTSSKSQKDNTSIPTQMEAIERFCEVNGWKLLKFYVDESKSGKQIAGREHFQEMMRDAALGKFNVVIPYDVTRFGRDGLDILSSAKTLKQDFGVDTVDTRSTYDSRSKQVITNYVNAGLAEDERIRILTRTYNGKLRKAKEDGVPSIGGPKCYPFGRTYDKQEKKWKIDKAKQKVMVEIAERYIQSESLEDLAKEFQLDYSNLSKNLGARCGDKWVIEFNNEELDIHEQVTIKIPALLDHKLIQAVEQRKAAKNTYARKSIRHDFLLARVIFCGHCDRALTPQVSSSIRYYRHASLDYKSRSKCPNCLQGQVRADHLEDAVIRQLFACFGNPVAVEQAIKDAAPYLEKREKLTKELDRIEQELSKIKRTRDNRQRELDDGIVAYDDKYKDALRQLSDREGQWKAKRLALLSQQANLPSAERIKSLSEQVAKRFGGKKLTSARLTVKKERLNAALDQMSYEDKRSLVEMVFSGKMGDGKRMGVYVERIDGQGNQRPRKWSYAIHGHLIEEEGQLPVNPKHFSDEDFSARLQKDLREHCVSKSQRSSALRPSYAILFALNGSTLPKLSAAESS